MKKASIGISDPDANLIQLLERLATGEKIIITRDGEPVAELVPVSKEHLIEEDAVDQMIQFSRGRSGKGLNIREMVEEGRRW